MVVQLPGHRGNRLVPEPSPHSSPSHRDAGRGRPIPEGWDSAAVATEICCRNCGYDLRSLRADGKCPECGLEIWQSVLHTIDPAASRLPRIRNPKAVGDALLVMAACMLLGTVLLAARPLAVEIDSWNQRGTWRLRDYVPGSFSLGSVLIFMAGVWAIWRLAPPRGKEASGAIWVDLWLIIVGFVGWLVSATLLGDAIDRGFASSRVLILHTSASVTAVVGLIGLRGVLGVIGRRSREYRKSRGGRQGVEGLIAAIALGLIGAAVQHLAVSRFISRGWLVMGSVILWASTFMLVIGLVYMVVNAWWIRMALRKPAPPMDEVLILALPPDTHIPDRED